MKIDSKVKPLDVVVSGNRVVIEEGEEYRLKHILAILFTNKQVLDVLIKELKKGFSITKKRQENVNLCDDVVTKYDVQFGKSIYILDKIIYEIGDPYNLVNLFDILQNERKLVNYFPITSLETSLGNRHEIHYKDKKYHLCDSTKERTDEELLSLYFVWLYYIEQKKYKSDFKLCLEFQKQDVLVNLVFE